MKSTATRIVSACFGVAVVFASGTTLAQTRNQPIRVIIPATPGGLLDGSVRRIAPRMGEVLGQPVIIENRAGANGLIGMAEVAKSAPDGQTLMYYNESVALIPYVVKNPGLDSLRDFTPITQTLSASFGLFVHPSVPSGTLKEFVAHTRANPGKVNGSSGGIQTSSGLFFEAFKQASGADMQHIPYKSAGQVVTDFLSGQLQVFTISTTLMAPHVRSGKARALAVARTQRAGQLPDVPTFAEAGYPIGEYSTWLGFFGPAKLPAATAQRIYEAAKSALSEAAMQKGFVDQGLDVFGTTPADFAKFVLSENAKFGKVAAAAGVQPE